MPETSVRTGLLILVAVLAVGVSSRAHALPPGGSDIVQVTAQASLTSRLGQETINFTGIATIARSDPYLEGGVEVVDLEITSLVLAGESLTGLVTIGQSATLASLGEIRSEQAGQEWPASALLDVFVDVAAPASPQATITKHNGVPIHIAPSYQGTPLPISAWPPTAVPWEAGLSTCVPLLPSLPKDVCVTELSLTMTATASGEVGGVAELPGVVGTGGGGSANAWLWLFGAAAMLAVLGGGVLVRRKLAG